MSMSIIKLGVYVGVVYTLQRTSLVDALDNGIAVTPPMGWRSWNCFLGDVSQEKMVSVIDAFRNRTLTVDGQPTSLLDLGYQHIGIDDGWQLCNSGSELPTSFHNAAGKPIVNTSKFPNLKQLSSYAETNGFLLGWYENNCICHESKGHIHNDTWIDLTYHGDVEQLVDNNFKGVKLDSCGLHSNVTYYSELINKTGAFVMIELCHQGSDTPTNTTFCPYNLYRTSGDIRSNFKSVIHNLQTVIPYLEAQPPLSFPGCWAYPDMLEVGRLASFEEDRTHFGGWAITSSPLILGLDVTNLTKLQSVWPIIANKEVIAVNQQWEGHPGRSINTTVNNLQVWAKLQPHASQAVFIFNNGNNPLNATVALSDLGLSGKVSVRDVWQHKNLDNISAVITVTMLQPHDSMFFVLTPT
eukprot:m.130100 g.130100  ORF g.130100 m.130100 type:complete len:411 (+) comp29458_c0_seq1:69-1301(+)